MHLIQTPLVPPTTSSPFVHPESKDWLSASCGLPGGPGCAEVPYMSSSPPLSQAGLPSTTVPTPHELTPADSPQPKCLESLSRCKSMPMWLCPCLWGLPLAQCCLLTPHLQVEPLVLTFPRLWVQISSRTPKRRVYIVDTRVYHGMVDCSIVQPVL